jgi:hypothetical protein
VVWGAQLECIEDQWGSLAPNLQLASRASLGSASNSNDLAPMGCLFELFWGVFGE